MAKQRTAVRPLDPHRIDQALARVHALLARECPAEQLSQATNEALRRVLADLATEDYDRHAVESREVTILLSDIRGFTSISERFAPAVVMTVLNHYFATMCEIIERYQGTIDKFMGDAIMVLFGAPERHDNDALNALMCAVEMQIAMDDLNRYYRRFEMPELYMGIGVNTGEVMAGTVGAELHREYTVIGDEVNLASRLEAYSLRGQVLISKNTYALTREHIRTGAAVEVYVKGKREPVTLRELQAVVSPVALEVPPREVRDSPRVKVNLAFEYQRVAGKQVLPARWAGTVRDISYNGLLAETPEELEAFAEIKFDLDLSFLGQQFGDIYAKVLRVRPSAGGYLSSLEFTSISVQSKAGIKDFVHHLIQGDLT